MVRKVKSETDAIEQSARPSAGSSSRQRVLDAAFQCFAAKGFHGTSMQEICARAEMSPGALYRYFPSKDAIIAAIAERERENNRRFIEQMQVTENVLETFMDTGFAWLRDARVRQAGALCTEVMAEAHRNPGIREIFERNLLETRGALRIALERAQRHGEIDAAIDLDVAVTVFMALGDGLLARVPLEPQMAPERIEPGLRLLMRRMLEPTARQSIAGHGESARAAPCCKPH